MDRPSHFRGKGTAILIQQCLISFSQYVGDRSSLIVHVGMVTTNIFYNPCIFAQRYILSFGLGLFPTYEGAIPCIVTARDGANTHHSGMQDGEGILLVMGLTGSVHN